MDLLVWLQLLMFLTLTLQIKLQTSYKLYEINNNVKDKESKYFLIEFYRLGSLLLLSYLLADLDVIIIPNLTCLHLSNIL